MIADGGGVIAHQVHRRDGRMAPGATPRRQVAQRRSLQKIAVVQKQGVPRRRPMAVHQRRDLGQASPGARPVGQIIMGHQLHVHVGRGQDSEGHGFGHVGWAIAFADLVRCVTH